MSRIKDCNIGTTLYRYVDGAGVFKYVVDGVREYPEGKQIEVECKTCSHGWQCRLLLAEDDYGRIVHVHMLNNDEEEDQKYWHTNDGFYFVNSSEEAKQQKVQKLVKDAEGAVRKAQDALLAAQKHLKDVKGLVEGVQE